MSERSCFIIAPAGLEVGVLADVITDCGWRILNLEMQTNAPAVRGAYDLIGGSDAVIVVDRGASPNLLFEAGIAVGRGKPVLWISYGESSERWLENSPSLLALPRLRVKSTDISGLSLHVPAFLASIEKGPNPHIQRVTKASPGRKYVSDEGGTVRPESELEAYLLGLLERSPEVLSVAHAARRPASDRLSITPDFAIWLGKDHQLIGNPVAVEVSHRLRQNDVGHKIEQLRHYAMQADVSTVLLVEDDPALALTVVDFNPLVVRVGLQLLEHLLLDAGLVAAITRSRNQAAHGLR